MEAVFNVSLVAYMAQMAHFVYCVAAIVYGRLERLTPWYDSKAYLLEYWASPSTALLSSGRLRA